MSSTLRLPGILLALCIQAPQFVYGVMGPSLENHPPQEMKEMAHVDRAVLGQMPLPTNVIEASRAVRQSENVLGQQGIFLLVKNDNDGASFSGWQKKAFKHHLIRTSRSCGLATDTLRNTRRIVQRLHLQAKTFLDQNEEQLFFPFMGKEEDDTSASALAYATLDSDLNYARALVSVLEQVSADLGKLSPEIQAKYKNRKLELLELLLKKHSS